MDNAAVVLNGFAVVTVPFPNEYEKSGTDGEDGAEGEDGDEGLDPIFTICAVENSN